MAYQGPRGGEGWQNEAGKVRYVKDQPGRRGHDHGSTVAVTPETKWPELSHAMAQWRAGLTEKQKNMLFQWGGSGRPMRLAQAGRREEIGQYDTHWTDQDLQEWDRLLDSAPKYHGTVYRGLSNVPSSVVSQWLGNGEIVLDNDQSSSRLEQESTKWFGGGLRDGAEVQWRVKQRTGALVEAETGVYYGEDVQTGKVNEAEVILRQGTRYRIADVRYLDRFGNEFPTPETAEILLRQKIGELEYQAERLQGIIADRDYRGKDPNRLPSWWKEEETRLADVQSKIKDLQSQQGHAKLPDDFLPHEHVGNAGYGGGHYVFDLEEIPDEPVGKKVPQVETPEFKRWFGESKVVGDDGAPLVLYHGTASRDDIESFENPYTPGWNYFTDSADYAGNLALIQGMDTQGIIRPARVYPVFLQIERPLDLRSAFPDPEQVWAPDFFRYLKSQGIDTSGFEPSGKQKYERPVHVLDLVNSLRARGNSARDAFLAAGYDGMIFPDRLDTRVNKETQTEKATTYLVFDPRQIKSAIGNRGTFDPESRKINESFDETKVKRDREGQFSRQEGRGVSAKSDKPARREPPDLASPRPHPTETDEFRKWFGASKIRHPETGKPLVVYHGTTRQIDAFNRDKPHHRIQDTDNISELGYFFTPREDVAEGYSDKRFNPEARKQWDRERNITSSLVPVYLSISNPKVYDSIGDFYREAMAKGKSLREELLAAGYDGVWAKGKYGDDEIVAFEPNQIKSATGNRGTFDPTSPKINESTAREAWIEYDGPLGGEGWQNTETGKVAYVKEQPGQKREGRSAEPSVAKDPPRTSPDARDVPSPEEFRKYLTDNADKWGFDTKTIERLTTKYAGKGVREKIKNLEAADYPFRLDATPVDLKISGSPKTESVRLTPSVEDLQDIRNGKVAIGPDDTIFVRHRTTDAWKNDFMELGVDTRTPPPDMTLGKLTLVNGEWRQSRIMEPGLYVEPNTVSSNGGPYGVILQVKAGQLKLSQESAELGLKTGLEGLYGAKDAILAGEVIPPENVVGIYDWDDVAQKPVWIPNPRNPNSGKLRVGANGGLEMVEDAGPPEPVAKTDTPEFKAWFGKSKVVGKDGQPLVVYHGTSNSDPFEEFKHTKDLGYHVGTLEQANDERFVSGRDARVMPLYLSIQKPLQFPDMLSWKPGAIVDELHRIASTGDYQELTPAVVDEIDNARSEAFGNAEIGQTTAAELKAIKDGLIRLGFDGIRYGNRAEGPEMATSWIAFHPEQIKSATTNRGTYAPRSPKITETRFLAQISEPLVFEREFDETKVVRDKEGQFADKPGVGDDELKGFQRAKYAGKKIEVQRAKGGGWEFRKIGGTYWIKPNSARAAEIERQFQAHLRKVERGTKAAPEEPKGNRDAARDSEPWQGGKIRRGQVYNIPTKELLVDPERFQFKIKVNREGVTEELKSVRVWNPDFAGVLGVWRDPANGKTFVVNGHHRAELAHRLGVEELPIRYFEAATAEEARALGALTNITEGRGTAVDAAKFMRDSGYGLEEFEKRGVSLEGKVSADALVLLDLSDRSFGRVVREQLDTETAVAVARELKSHELQDQLFRVLEKREQEGKDTSLKVIGEMAREMAETPVVKGKQASLFGDIETEDSLFVPRNELKAAVRADLVREARDFELVANRRRAEAVAGAGNVLNLEQNRQLARDAEQNLAVYNGLANRRGPISDALNAGAARLAEAKSRRARDEVRRATIEAVRDALAQETLDSRTAGSADGPGPGIPAAGPGAPAGAADAGRGDPGKARLSRQEVPPGERHVVGPTPDDPQAPWRGGEIKPGRVYNAPVSELQVDPQRFQFKLRTDAQGVTQELKQVRAWNPDFAGVVSVWRDPQDGKTYVVNGHHRYELANRLGVGNLAIRYLDAKDHVEARSKGALINIAEGRGTAVDAAKFLKDTNLKIEDIQERGVSLKGRVAGDATVLAGLSDQAFDRLVRGTLDTDVALAVGRSLQDHGLQDQLFGLLERREEAGRDTSLRTIGEMARELAEKHAPRPDQAGKRLFEPDTLDPLFEPRNELKALIQADITREARDFAAVASRRRAVAVADAGNVLNLERNREISDEAERILSIYQTLKNRRGLIADALEAGAAEWAAASTKGQRDVIRKRTLRSVRDAVLREAGEGDAGTGPEVAGRSGPDAAGPGPDAGTRDQGRRDSPTPGLMFGESAPHPLARIVALLESRQAPRRYLVRESIVLESNPNWDETKVKRDEGGRFAEQEGRGGKAERELPPLPDTVTLGPGDEFLKDLKRYRSDDDDLGTYEVPYKEGKQQLTAEQFERVKEINQAIRRTVRRERTLRWYAEGRKNMRTPATELTKEVFAARERIKELSQLRRDRDRHGELFKAYRDAIDSDNWRAAGEIEDQIKASRTLKTVTKRYQQPWQDKKEKPWPGSVWDVMREREQWLLQKQDDDYWSETDLHAKHEEIVKKAVLAGENVSDEVLSDYYYTDWMPEGIRQAWHQKEMRDRRAERVNSKEALEAFEKLQPEFKRFVDEMGRRGVVEKAAEVWRHEDLMVRELELRAKENDISQADLAQTRNVIKKKLDELEAMGPEAAAAAGFDIEARRNELRAVKDQQVELVVARKQIDNELSNRHRLANQWFLEDVLKQMDGKGGLAVELDAKDFPHAQQHADHMAQATAFLGRVAAPITGALRIKVVPYDGKDGRSRAGGQEMNMHETAGPTTYVHELGHIIEDQLGLYPKAFGFLVGQVRGLPVEHLGQGFEPDEFAVKDDFRSKYAGKIYPYAATEILSMGLQELYTNPYGFAKESPRHFWFTLAALQGKLR